jgi:hypothetical protein
LGLGEGFRVGVDKMATCPLLKPHSPMAKTCNTLGVGVGVGVEVGVGVGVGVGLRVGIWGRGRFPAGLRLGYQG